MRFHWLRDPHTLKEIRVYWAAGTNNDSEYFTKTHTTPTHRSQRSNYVQDHLNHISTDCDLHIFL